MIPAQPTHTPSFSDCPEFNPNPKVKRRHWLLDPGIELHHDKITMKKIHILLPALVVISLATQITAFGDIVRPKHKALITCFNGRIDSRSKCSATNFQHDGTIFPTGGPMRCGFPGKVSSISWKLLMTDEGGDHYEFIREFPHGEDEAMTQKKRIRYTGQRIVIFKDGDQVIVIDPPPGDRKKPEKDGPEGALSFPETHQQSTQNRDDIGVKPESGKLLDSALIPKESVVLKQAMLDVTFALMVGNDPTTEREDVRSKAEDFIALTRKDVPDFLMLTRKDEDELRAGRKIHKVDRRISVAEAFLREIEIELSGLVTSLLSQYKAGTLSVPHTELLAQLMVAEMKKTRASLTE